MKVLYVKNNSERSKEFQIRTKIIKKDNKKIVTKEAITSEAKKHIDHIVNNYSLLKDSIINSKIKLANIIKKDIRSLTFEFINGVSLEKKLENTKNKKEIENIINNYIYILKNSFKTTKFNHNTMTTSKMKMLFGDFDYSVLDDALCYDKISNLDMIFSNIIFKNEYIYIIDYEWVYNISIPIDFILYRVSLQLPQKYKKYLEKEVDKKREILYYKMEKHFIDNYIMKGGFYFTKHKYIKLNLPIAQQIEEIKKENKALKEENKHLKNVGKELAYAHSIIELRDKQIQSLLLKNRIKSFINKLNPFSNKTQQNNILLNNNIDKYIYNPPKLTEAIKKEIELFAKQPLISIIIPVYNVDPKWLNLAIESVKNQWYSNWEISIVDDKSTNSDTIEYLKKINHNKINVKFLDKNMNISGASNEAIAISNGEYIALLDNDDEYTPDALYEIVKAINYTDADFIYSDEDFIDTEGNCSNPHYKPDFSPDLLLSHNYITHICVFKKELFNKVGGFDCRYDGSQDYDLILRLTEKAKKIEHVKKVLYHWRTLETSTSQNADAKPEALERGKRVLEATIKRRGLEAQVEFANIPHYFRIKYKIKGNPLVSIIMPFKDKPELLNLSVNTILLRSSYINFEIIGISNNSQDKETFELMKKLQLQDPRVKFYEYNKEFNYAEINNYAVENFAKGEHILLLNNDIEVISSDWIEAMLEHSQREEVGCVGAKLYYPNDTIQHAGIILGLGGYAGHSHKHTPRTQFGYFNRLSVVQNVSAVTAACLMVKKSIYQEVRGMDEVNFKVAYNDVDFCLRVREKGYLNIFTPYAELYHHESVSRGYEDTSEKLARFQKEKEALYNRHKYILDNGDPYYNPNLTHDKEDFTIKVD